MTESIDIRPSARILKVLGDIDFENWQCLAELADNAFDDFADIKRSGEHWPDGFRVSISLPHGVITADAEVVVTDTGRGMDLQTLNNAVRAGWSSNDPFSKLGLFGMGFNIATARLGRMATVLTTRQGDDEWVGVTIDLDRIRDDFAAPVVREAKEEPRIHGTRVVVGKLDEARASWMARNQANLRVTLGDIYSHLLEHERFSLLVNGVQVRSRRACRWSEERSVTYGSGSQAEQIPAYLPVDRAFPPMETCLRCRNWQEPGRGVCLECGATILVERVRRIHGWLGIQRYLHKNEYGIDFFRNGRKILRHDKRLFAWTNPNDPLASTETEYPVELSQGGRIIGEIHLDHVPVNYQKTAFEWSDRNWIAAAEFLRGRGPLLPRRAEQLGWAQNNSPLSSLIKGYRRADPGYRCLIPGDGQSAIHAKAKEWAEFFHRGDPEYQDDSKWWESVVFHERQKLNSQEPNEPGGGGTGPQGEALKRLGLEAAGKAPPGSVAPVEPKTEPETEQQRLARFRSHGTSIPSLSGEFGLVELGASVRLTTIAVRGTEVRDKNGTRSPVLLAREPRNAYVAVVDMSHPVFEEFADEPEDYVLIELAEHLRVRASSDTSLSQIVAILKDKHLAERKVDLGTAAAEAKDVLRLARDRMADAIKTNPDRIWQVLHPDERTATELNLVNDDASLTLAEAQRTGQFVVHAPAMSLPRMLEEWPEAFMDGAVFGAPYASIGSPGARRLSLGRLVGYVYDAARVATVDVMPPRELQRARVSVSLLLGELAV